MDLIQFRVRSHQDLDDSHWLSIREGINLLDTDDMGRSTALLEFLATINPPHDSALQVLDTRAALYSRTERHGRRRIIRPKKTAAIAVFSSTPELVMNIADIDDDLFETDRIEVGRRLDHSRWMNFVEISSSTRWKELKPVITRLLDGLRTTLPGPTLQPLQELIADFRETDRLRRSLDTRLLHLLQPLAERIPPHLQNDYDLACRLVGRAERFLEAKQRVFDMLPVFLHLKLKGGNSRNGSAPGEEIDIREAVYQLTNPPAGRTSPFYLVDCSRLNGEEFARWADGLKNIPRKPCIMSCRGSHHNLLPDASKVSLPPLNGNHSSQNFKK